MAKNSAINLDVTNNNDGFYLQGGLISGRKITIVSGDTTLIGGATVSNGQLLIGNASTNGFEQGSITAGTGLIITSGAGTLILNVIQNTGAGEANTASNLGSGVGLFNNKSSFDLQFNSISGRSGVQVQLFNQTIIIDSTSSSSSSQLYDVVFQSGNQNITGVKTFINSGIFASVTGRNSIPDNSIIYAVGPDGSATRITFDTYNQSNFGSSFRGRHARGFANLPSGVLADDILLQIVGDGYNTTGFSSAAASLAIGADENWTTSSNPTYFTFRTTPIGSTSSIERVRIDNSGSVAIGDFSQITLLPNNPLAIGASGDTYLQVNIQNKSNGQNASSDLVLTNDIGNDVSGYVDLGINSSRYTGQFVGSSGDAYLYSTAGDFYIGNTVTGKRLFIFADHPVNNSGNATVTIQNDEFGINNPDPKSALDVVGSGNITEGWGSKYLSLNKNTDTPIPINNDQTTLFFDNQAQRSILSYANNRGIGKAVQNTFFGENIHLFMPNTTTSMTVFGTTATTVGTLSHPTTFIDLTRDGYATNFVSPAGASNPIGVMSSTTPFFLTSGVTGLGAGFYFAAHFTFPDNSGLYAVGTGSTGLNTGIRFFAGMTDGATTLSTVNAPYPTQALLGFQLVRSSGVSGRIDDTFKFVSKDNGASAPFYVQETNCQFKTGCAFYSYIYGRTDFRAGVHWMIRNATSGLLYSGDFTGQFANLPLVTSAAQRLLKPALGIMIMSGLRNIKTKGLYCETV